MAGHSGLRRRLCFPMSCTVFKNQPEAKLISFAAVARLQLLLQPAYPLMKKHLMSLVMLSYLQIMVQLARMFH
jgi:hypothetical protein